MPIFIKFPTSLYQIWKHHINCELLHTYVSLLFSKQPPHTTHKNKKHESVSLFGNSFYEKVLSSDFSLIHMIKGIVTRRPLVLQLHKTEGGIEYAEFLHAPRKRFTDFGMF